MHVSHSHGIVARVVVSALPVLASWIELQDVALGYLLVLLLTLLCGVLAVGRQWGGSRRLTKEVGCQLKTKFELRMNATQHPVDCVGIHHCHVE